MFYTIYKITNKINNKFYIGMHKTNNLDDGYMGSGKLLKRAVKKYGIKNFIKEILYVFDNEEDMKNKEKELVVISEQSYNLCEGGHGGFSYINRNPEKFLTEKRLNSLMSIEKTLRLWRLKYDNDEKFREESRQRSKKALIKAKEIYSNGFFYGRKHTEQTKLKMRKSKNVGSDNSQYGTCWITNGSENKKIKSCDIDKWINLGYYKGRIIKNNASLV